METAYRLTSYTKQQSQQTPQQKQKYISRPECKKAVSPLACKWTYGFFTFRGRYRLV